MCDTSNVGRVGDVGDLFGVEFANVDAVVVSFFKPPGALLENVNKRTDLT